MHLDDVVLFLQLPRDHVNQVKRVLSHMQCGSHFEVEKRDYITGIVEYSGHIFQPQRLDIATLTLEATKGLKLPTNITSFRSFYRVWNVFRRFVPSFLQISAPLNSKLVHNEPKHFKTLKVDKLHAVHKIQKNGAATSTRFIKR